MPWRRERALHCADSTISFGGMTLVDEITKPVIAAILGHCIAGGLELACGIRLCTPEARFGLAEVRWGVLPGRGGTPRLPRLVPVGRALEMILTGDPIDAHRAERIGLVNRLVTADALLDTAAMAKRIASNGPLADKAAKRAIQHGLDGSLEEGLILEGALQKQLLQTGDAEEGLRAFAERRPPVFATAAAMPVQRRWHLCRRVKVSSTLSGSSAAGCYRVVWRSWRGLLA
jgi:E-phenylitaconyl-CoA hydratase